MDRVSISNQAKNPSPSEEKVKASEFDAEKIIQSNPHLMRIKQIIEAITGKEIKLAKISNREASSDEIDCGNYQGENAPSPDAPVTEGWGLRYDYNETYAESEVTSFAAKGIVKTTDGKEVAFTLDLQMSRQFMEQQDISIRAGDAARIDPLVITFSGTAAELTDWTFAFDLNSECSLRKSPRFRQA